MPPFESLQQRGRARRHPLDDGAALSGVRRQIRSDLNEAGVDPGESFDCLVAVTEACSNAILHGQGDAIPQISWSIGEGAVSFLIEDYSTRQWSMSEHPSRPVDLSFDETARVGGFGLELMRGLMDEVDIRISNRGTSVALTKNLCQPVG